PRDSGHQIPPVGQLHADLGRAVDDVVVRHHVAALVDDEPRAETPERAWRTLPYERLEELIERIRGPGPSGLARAAAVDALGADVDDGRLHRPRELHPGRRLRPARRDRGR